MDTEGCEGISRTRVQGCYCHYDHGDYLRKWGFTPQKPKKRAYEQCPKKVQKWLDEDYPVIKEQAKQEDAEIYWGDFPGVRV